VRDDAFPRQGRVRGFRVLLKPGGHLPKLAPSSTRSAFWQRTAEGPVTPRAGIFREDSRAGPIFHA
jgi:hypothetical protein